MIVLSLFDGMSCGQIALKKLGVEPEIYFASEISRTAISAVSLNFPNTVFLGDIENWHEWGVPWESVDLIIGGSPCQGFSLLGKREGLKDPRSRLFFKYLEILKFVKWVNPKVKFLLENVRMPAPSRAFISEQVGESPTLIDAKNFSACARPRLFWFNWQYSEPAPSPKQFGDFVDFNSGESNLSEGWHRWWKSNGGKRLEKQYSKIVPPEGQGLTMTARQYANWNGNFIENKNGILRKPTGPELARLVGAPPEYFKNVSQRAAEEMTGNGWSIPVIYEIFKQGGLNK